MTDDYVWTCDGCGSGVDSTDAGLSCLSYDMVDDCVEHEFCAECSKIMLLSLEGRMK